MSYPKDFKGKPLSLKKLSEIVTDQNINEQVLIFCSLAVLGISKNDKIAAKEQIDKYMGKGFELAVLKEVDSLRVFGTNDRMTHWQYLVDLPLGYRTFYEDNKIHYVNVN